MQTILTLLNAINPANDTEAAIKQDLLTNCPDPQGDDLLSHIEETYQCLPLGTNPTSTLDYFAGVDFLTKYNLMP